MARAKPGKYDLVLPGLKPLPPSDLEWQAKVEAVKIKLTNRDPVALATRYIELREQKDTLKAALQLVELQVEAHEQLLIASEDASEYAWGRYGVKPNALRLEAGHTIRVQPEPYGRVEDKEKFRLWCIANGYERQLQLWPSTMNTIIKERLLAGDPEPDGTQAYAYYKVVLVKKGEET